MKKLAFIMPVLSGIMWGSAGLFVRQLGEIGMNSYTIVSTRVVAAVVILWIGISLLDRSLFRIKIRELWIFIAGGIVGMFGLNLCYNEAIEQLTLSLAAVLLSLSPIFVLFLAAILFREKITWKKTVCMCMALAGCILASGVLETGSGMKWTAAGILIGGAGAFFYGLYSIFTKVAMGKGYHALTITFYCLVMVMLVLLPLTDWKGVGIAVSEGGGRFVLFMLLHSLCTSVLPYVLYTVSLEYVEAGKASILAAGEPVAAMVFGAVFYSEIPTALSLIGLVLTIVALTLMSMPDRETS